MTKYTTGAEAPCESSASHRARSLNPNEKTEVQTSKGENHSGYSMTLLAEDAVWHITIVRPTRNERLSPVTTPSAL